MQATEKTYLSPAELAVLADVTVDTVYDWIWDGVRSKGRRVRLRADRIGGRWRIRPDAWEQFKTDCNGGPVQTAAEQSRREQEIETADRKVREMLRMPPRK